MLICLWVFTGCGSEFPGKGLKELVPRQEKPFEWPTRDKAAEAAANEGNVEDALPLQGRYASFQQIFADVAERAIPGVVSIYSERTLESLGFTGPNGDFFNFQPFDHFFGESDPSEPRKETGLGSGVIISTDGYLITNFHVIEGADVIKVKLSDGSEYVAEIVGTDKSSDMAVIRIPDARRDLPVVPVGDSDKLRIGEWVLAVGNPYGLTHTVTTGIISAMGRRNTGITGYEDFLQTDAAINPGNSGGALMNLDGELIGINTAIFSRTGGYQGIGFAIPINMAKRITEDLIRDGEVTRGWLGVSIQGISGELAEALALKEQQGALVGDVIPGSPAEKAGIKRGDIIRGIDGETVRDVSDLLNQVAMIKPGKVVEVEILRDGGRKVHKAKIARRDENRLSALELNRDLHPQKTKVGLEVAELTQEAVRKYGLGGSLDHGVVVASVAPDSRAADAKLQEGDIILEVNRTRIRSVPEFNRALESGNKGNRLLLLVHRQGKTFFTTL